MFIYMSIIWKVPTRAENLQLKRKKRNFEYGGRGNLERLTNGNRE